MDGFGLAVWTALWLGILTSVSPCPLATNIVAISFIGSRVGSPRLVLLNGILYTLGRTVTYVVLGGLLASSLLSAPYLSNLLQKYANKILGPVLIVAGMFLLELIRVDWKGSGLREWVAKRFGEKGLAGSALLGAVFALSFCPVSAALFFGGLLPLAVQHHSTVLLPSLYGVGTAVSVVVVAVAFSLGARSFGKAFARVSSVEKWARRVTGAAFIIAGVYITLTSVFGVLS
jgi:cytochrome c biogenesis protein CcdA